MKFILALCAFAASAAAFAPAATPSVARTQLYMANHLELTTGKAQLDHSVVDRFNELPYPADKVLAEYVWVDAKGETRSKPRTLPATRAKAVDTLPRWNFDGSSTGQAPGDDSEVILRPCRIFSDPFRPRNDGLDNILVMCDTYTPAGEPLPTNTRAIGKLAFVIHLLELIKCHCRPQLENKLPLHQPQKHSRDVKTKKSGLDWSKNSPFSISIKEHLSDGPKTDSLTAPKGLTTALSAPRIPSAALSPMPPTVPVSTPESKLAEPTER